MIRRTWTWLGVFRSKRPQKNSEEIPGKHFFSFGKVHLQKKVGNLRIDENFYFLVHRTEWSKLRIQQQILSSQYILRWTFFVYFHFMKIFFPFKILGIRHSLHFHPKGRTPYHANSFPYFHEHSCWDHNPQPDTRSKSQRCKARACTYESQTF